MYTKLDELNRLNNAMDDIVAGVERCNEVLEAEYKQHESERLDEFMKTMSELAGYAKNLNQKVFRTDIVYQEKQYEYNDWDHVLIFNFKKDGNFNIEINMHGHCNSCLYSSALAEYEIIHTNWSYLCDDAFKYGWGIAYTKSGKKFIAIHANEIIDTVRGMIEQRFEQEIKSKANNARKKQEQIIADIERVKK